LPVLLSAACNPFADRHSAGAQRSFCYWGTAYNPDTALLKETGANHFYVRYFDVDWDYDAGEAKPIASLSTSDTISLNFTPSVFFTNKVFEKSTEEQLRVLSARVKKRIEELSENFGHNAFHQRGLYTYQDEASDDPDRRKQYDLAYRQVMNEYNERYDEVLIDCDWTARTRDKFFYFVECLKKDMSGKEITVTLRLWQYRQNKPADIPPVKRCLLMCYNMQSANDFNVQNSIASPGELKKYVSGKKYPLKLDVALPLFGWAILFRDEEFVGLLGRADNKDFADNFIEYENLGDGRYRSLTDKVMGDFFVRKGDIIRVEQASGDELHQMAGYLKKELPTRQDTRITFFSWNKIYINNYGTDEIKKIYAAFDK
jgi:hypothetical protein